MGEPKKPPRVATEPIEIEEVSIVDEIDQVSATPKKAPRAIGTAPPAATQATVGDDWLDRLDL